LQAWDLHSLLLLLTSCSATTSSTNTALPSSGTITLMTLLGFITSWSLPLGSSPNHSRQLGPM
jgi:hypothetical protein